MERSSRHFTKMDGAATALLIEALATAILLTVPAISVVAGIGVVVGVLQTIFQIQDSNVSFLPKFVAVAAVAIIGGPPALALVRDLIVNVAHALPRLATG